METRPAAVLTRRHFLQRTLAGAAALHWPNWRARAQSSPSIQTVLGPLPAARLGMTLPHEHVMCDFIGAEQTRRERWKVDEVVATMQPYLTALKRRGVTGFVDCTPAYIGRDPRVLKLLAQSTGLHILTNTGYYGGAGDKFVPKHAYQESVEQLAGRWLDEFKNGIEDAGVKPGFIKIGIDEVSAGATTLSAIDDKLVRAAARVSIRSNLAVTCHTGGGLAGLLATRVFIAEKGTPGRFIVAHSDGHGLAINRQIAELGAWVSFDAVSRRPLQEHLQLVQGMVRDHADRLLLSHDNGWYWVGESGGGQIRDFNYLTDTFLPAARKDGINDAAIQKIIRENPARAFGI